MSTINQELKLTARPISEGIEPFINKKIPVLDHGYIILRDYLGNDESIANAARTSYQKGTKTVQDDANLIRYLIEHHHNTPVEQCEIQFEVKLPIFVARQWIRHRTANVNEMSARYSVLEKEFYIPAAEQCLPQSKTNKQGRDENGGFDSASVNEIRSELQDHSITAYELYEVLLGENAEGEPNDGPGLARELSRMVLPVNFYTRWVWKIDLHNLFNFLRLRMDSHAQYEIRVYADAIYEIVKAWVPDAAAAFDNAVWRAVTFTGEEIAIIREMMHYNYNITDFTPDNWSERRVAEFERKLRGS